MAVNDIVGEGFVRIYAEHTREHDFQPALSAGAVFNGDALYLDRLRQTVVLGQNEYGALYLKPALRLVFDDSVILAMGADGAFYILADVCREEYLSSVLDDVELPV